jgi:hypothetical protein
MSATLMNDGDSFERHYWSAFIQTEFPNYEKYWANNIVPMTNRPTDIHFKNSSILNSAGYTADDICKAQLHYTTFRHLVRSFELLNHLKTKDQNYFDIDLLSEGLFHVTAAQDVAFEFLQRVTEPNKFDPWAPKNSASLNKLPTSKKALKKWKSNNGYPLQYIRDYRNHLTHGRMSPNITINTKVLIPKIGFENAYLDWRLVTDSNLIDATGIKNDFDTLDNILADAWKTTIGYFESEWSKIV